MVDASVVPPPFPLAQTGGFATSATSTTLTDSSKSWTTSQYVGSWVLILQGTGSIQAPLQITANTATQITVAGWTVTPDTTSQYCIFPFQPVITPSGTPGTITNGLAAGATIQGPPYGVVFSQDYILYQSGGIYYAAASPQSGRASYSATTGNAIMTSAINALRGAAGSGLGGGAISLGSAFLPITNTITTYPGIAFKGNAILSAFPTIGTEAFQPTAFNTPVIDVVLDPNNTGLTVFPAFERFVINGPSTSNTSQHGIFIDNTNGLINDVFVDEVAIFGVGGDGFHINNGGKHWFDKCYSEDNLHGAGFNIINANAVRIVNSYIFGNGTGGILANSLNYSKFTEIGYNEINNNVQQAMSIAGAGTFLVSNNIMYDNGSNTVEAVTIGNFNVAGAFLDFSHNKIWEDRASGTRSKYAVNVTATKAVQGLMVNNQFLGTFLSGVYNDSGWHSTLAIRNNSGLNPFGSLATPFGGTITNPFNASNGGTVGYGGNITTPLTTVTYTANAPVDVTIAAGTTQTITTKDNLGNTIDSAVATLSHRLLLENYTITVTASAVGATTVVQASVGLGGTTATMAANVNYVVCGCDCFVSGGTVLTGLVIGDGTNNTGGNSIATGSATAFPATGMLLPVGWNFHSTAVTTSPTVVGN